MTTRYSASVAYGGGSVNVEVDVSAVTEKVPSDSSPTGWRGPDGTFAQPPAVDADELEDRARDAVRTAARNIKSDELARELRNAEIAVEDGEATDEPPRGVQETVRLDPDGTGDWVEYEVRGNRLERRDP